MTPTLIGGGAVGVGMILVAGLIRFFFGDTKAFDVLHEEIRALREQQTENTLKIATLEAMYDEQRKEKHAVINKYARSQILLRVIAQLSEQCTCGALNNVRELLDQALLDIE